MKIKEVAALASGEWVPDECSIQASLENAILVLDFLEEREV